MMWGLYFIVGAFALYVLLPYFDKAYRGRKMKQESPEVQDLTYRKNEILASINDLEYDFQMKKITEPDYLQLKEKLTQEYIVIKKQLDQFPEMDQQDAGANHQKREPHQVGS